MKRDDAAFMALAIAEARKALGRTHPNPAVGAVLVKRGEVVGRGFHARAGQPHAEIVALRDAGAEAKGATLYSTLEPCNHHGRTPPCTEAIIAAGVRRVVYGSADPNPLVNGKGRRRLVRAGIAVTPHVLRDEADALNRPFLKAMTTGRAWVTLKAGITLDGKLATGTGRSKWITSEAAREEAHRLRDRADAILVGATTVRRDDPALTTRLPGGRSPARLVLDPNLSTSPKAKLYAPTGGTRRIVVTTAAAADRASAFLRRGVEVWPLAVKRGRLDLDGLLVRLAHEGLLHLLVEGGALVHQSFLRAGLADEVVLFVAPKLFGDPGLTWTGALGVERPEQAVRLEGLEARPVGPDLMITARLRARARSR
ncbi:MAG: bifunctional diaminohydroxyphosphoribosylaminopyrimidine deaminase/5-amino-6-(5-phosphoribosylamino)uracil reductase RibD [Myxococcota bacterium]